MVTTPDRTLEQRMEALTRANEIRTKRATLKRDLKASRAEATALLLDPPDWLEQMKVFEVMLALPKWGRVKATRTLRLLEVAPSKTVGGMTERQRTDVVRAIEIGPVSILEERVLRRQDR